MEVLECIKTRRSIRNYLDKPVPWELVANVLEAGRYSPTAGNLQNWKFIAVMSDGRRKAIAEACVQQYWMEKAPVQIVICSEPEKGEMHYGKRGKENYSLQNCAGAAMAMLLEAHEQGLGGCWVGAFNEEQVKKALGIPKDAKPEVIITIGYANETPAMPTRHPLEVVAYWDKWRGKFRDVMSYLLYYAPKTQHYAKKTKEAIQKGSQMAVEKAQEIAKKIKEKF